MTPFATLVMPFLDKNQETTAIALMGKKAKILQPNGNSMKLSEWLSDDVFLTRSIDNYDNELQAPTRLVASLLFQKKMVRGLIGGWLANALLGEKVVGKVLDLWILPNQVERLSFSTNDSHVLSEIEIIEACNQLSTFLATAFIESGIPKSDAWGNVGLAVADPWMAARKIVNDIDTLIANYEAFTCQLIPELQSTILALPIEKDGQKQVVFKRPKKLLS
ncbi:hypothetical protein [Suttonella ornithocola]|uniref:hypothetical protein n=1 Tax=Suttonella ornithocola TaxID=279832 RepID=UPI00093477EF|nr:hypothetical protein [Suttonella ornithocola]